VRHDLNEQRRRDHGSTRPTAGRTNLTRFEYAPGDSAAFEELVRRLRETEEWRYVEREVDVRLARDDG